MNEGLEHKPQEQYSKTHNWAKVAATTLAWPGEGFRMLGENVPKLGLLKKQGASYLLAGMIGIGGMLHNSFIESDSQTYESDKGMVTLMDSTYYHPVSAAVQNLFAAESMSSNERDALQIPSALVDSAGAFFSPFLWTGAGRAFPQHDQHMYVKTTIPYDEQGVSVEDMKVSCTYEGNLLEHELTSVRGSHDIFEEFTPKDTSDLERACAETIESVQTQELSRFSDTHFGLTTAMSEPSQNAYAPVVSGLNGVSVNPDDYDRGRAETIESMRRKYE